MATGKVIIISAPSGSGKSSIVGRVIGDPALRLEFSISATTRPPRGHEVNGKEYYFMTTDAFKQAIANDELVEYQEVYPGRYYGTLRSEVERIMNKGDNVVLDIDVLGGLNVKKIYGQQALSIFIQAPSVEELRHRLYARGTDTVEEIEKRVNKAQYEMSFANQFDRRVINDDLDKAVDEVHSLIARFEAGTL